MKKAMLGMACSLVLGAGAAIGQPQKENPHSDPYIIPRNTDTVDHTISDGQYARSGSFRYPVMVKANSFIPSFYWQWNPVAIRNSFEKSTAGVSGMDVIRNYLNALGNPDRLKNIRGIEFQGQIRIKNVTLGFYEKRKAPNLDYIAMSVDGDTVMRSEFRGETGYNQHSSEKIELSPAEIQERNRDYLGLFNQIYYLLPGKSFYLEKISNDTVEDEPCYRLDIRMPSGKQVSEFYEKESRLLVKTIEQETENGQRKTITKIFSGYQPFRSFLFPTAVKIHTEGMEIQQELTLTLQAIEVEAPDSAD